MSRSRLVRGRSSSAPRVRPARGGKWSSAAWRGAVTISCSTTSRALPSMTRIGSGNAAFFGLRVQGPLRTGSNRHTGRLLTYLSDRLAFLSGRQKLLVGGQKFLSVRQRFLSIRQKFLVARQKFLSVRQKFLSARQSFLSIRQKFLVAGLKFPVADQTVLVSRKKF